MSSATKRVVAVCGWDNRQPLADDISAQVQRNLSSGDYLCTACTVIELVRATMTRPNAGSNQVTIEIQVPTGTSDGTITALVTAVLTTLTLLATTVVVNTVTVF